MPLTKLRSPGIDQVLAHKRLVAVRAAGDNIAAVAVGMIGFALGLDIASRQWFAAKRAARGHALDVALRVIGLAILDIEAVVPYGEMAGGAKKMLRMPGCTKRGDIASQDWLAALLTDQAITHKQAFASLFDF